MQTRNSTRVRTREKMQFPTSPHTLPGLCCLESGVSRIEIASLRSCVLWICRVILARDIYNYRINYIETVA